MFLYFVDSTWSLHVEIYMWFVVVCTLYVVAGSCCIGCVSVRYSLQVTARIVGELLLARRRKGEEINVPD